MSETWNYLKFLRSTLLPVAVFIVLATAQPAAAEKIFTDFVRAGMRDFLREALAALDANDDVAAMQATYAAYINMEGYVKQFTDEQASGKGVTSGYEPRLNNFAGELPGFTKKVDEERAKREGVQTGAAITSMAYIPDNANRKPGDGVLLGIYYGISDAMIDQIKDAFGNSSKKTMNGYAYWVRGSENSSGEKSYAILLDDRLFVVIASGQFADAEAVINKLDIAGLSAFRQGG